MDQYGTSIFKFMKELKNQVGCEIVGMSSVGPSTVAVTSKNINDISPSIDKWGMELTFTTKVDNVGLTVERFSPLKLISVMGFFLSFLSDTIKALLEVEKPPVARS